jgi:flagellin
MATADAAGIVTLKSTNSSSVTVAVKGTYVAATLLANTGLAPATTLATKPTTLGAITANDLTINGVGISALGGGNVAAGGTFASQGANLADAINQSAGQTGVTATADATTGAISLSAVDGRNIVVAFAGASATAATTGLTAATTHGSVSLTSSNPAGIVVGGTASASAGLGDFKGQAVTADMTNGSALGSLDISTAAGAARALKTIDNALSSVNTARASMGAMQNRFASVVSNLQSTSENLTASRSRIQDADFAAETASLSRSQVLQQAGTAMVAQANQLPQGVLALLR